GHPRLAIHRTRAGEAPGHSASDRGRPAGAGDSATALLRMPRSEPGEGRAEVLRARSLVAARPAPQGCGPRPARGLAPTPPYRGRYDASRDGGTALAACIARGVIDPERMDCGWCPALPIRRPNAHTSCPDP